MPTVRLQIRGMTCAGCVRRVENALKGVQGVHHAVVNLATEQAEVESSEPVPLSALLEAVQQAGYSAVPLSETAEVPSLLSEEREAVAEVSTPYTATRLLLSALLTLPVFVLSMFLPGRLPYQEWLLLALTTPIQFGIALPLYRSAFGALRGGSANMEVLILLGTLSAYFYSLALTLQGHAHHLYYETSAVIITLVLFGRYLEGRARGQARSALVALFRLLPHQVLRYEQGEYQPVPLEQVRVGDHLLVRTGERVPVDGVVIEGQGWVDESALTGESLPRECSAGAQVLGGSLVVDGVLQIRAISVGQQTLLAQIARAVEHAQMEKAQIQRLADAVASVFVPIVVGLAVLTFIGWWFAMRSVGEALIPAVSVLVIACPCALGLAVPIALMTGSTRAMRAGILLKGITALERVRVIDTLVLDKTGTLTLGVPRLVRVHTFGVEEADALRLASALEHATRHPLGEAIIEYARARGLSPLPLKEVRTVPGGGVIGNYEGRTVLIGSARFLQEQGVPAKFFSLPTNTSTPSTNQEKKISPPKEMEFPVLLALERGVNLIPLSPHRKEGKPLRIVQGDAPKHEQDAPTGIPHSSASAPYSSYTLIAGFEFADEPLPELQAVLNELRAEGIELVLCSGDREEAVAQFAQSVGIERWYSAQLPHQKAQLVKELQAQGRRVAFVGDGINDAVALAQADLGIAVATGSEIATETADMVLLNRDLRTLRTAIRLAHRIYRTIRQNLFFAFVYNTLGIPLAMLGYLNPMVSALAMSLSSVSVVGNALRLLR